MHLALGASMPIMGRCATGIRRMRVRSTIKANLAFGNWHHASCQAFPNRAYSALQHGIDRVKDVDSTQPQEVSQRHAVVSTFDLLKIGIGPSSSHTVGPMRAARQYAMLLQDAGTLNAVATVRIDLYGSLALTGEGHGTPKAILMGLEGETPHQVNIKTIEGRVKAIYEQRKLNLLNKHIIQFDPQKHLVFHYRESLPGHPNGMRFSAFDTLGSLMSCHEYYSVGGGFFVDANETQTKNVYIQAGSPQSASQMPQHKGDTAIEIPFPFTTALDLLRICQTQKMSISDVVCMNERSWRSEKDILTGIAQIWKTMDESIDNGVHSTEIFLPGPLGIKRRAPSLYRHLLENYGLSRRLPYLVSAEMTKKVLSTMEDQKTKNSFTLDWLTCFSIAVNEENAAGGRIVTAPTNGAAGVIPAVLKYYITFISNHPEKDISQFLLTAAAIGMLYKRGASISAAEMGCQGEIGVASSMAAAGLAAVMGGTVAQTENAAEIAMEHSLGLTCDPIGGLVQIPCIERNAFGSAKAYTAAQLALYGNGVHRVSLDQVIETMRQTGHDMQSKYKETSLGGLAVNVPLC